MEALELASKNCEELFLLPAQLAWNLGWLEEAEAQEPLRPGARIGKRDESSPGIADQVESIQAVRVGEAVDRLELHLDRVVRRRAVFAIDLEVFEVQIRLVAYPLDEPPVTLARRSHAAGNADDLVFHTRALPLLISAA